MRERQWVTRRCAVAASSELRPETHAQRAEQLARLHVALSGLPAQDRRIVRWEYYEARTAAEANTVIVRELHIGVRQAKRLRARAIERLRSRLVVKP